MTIFAYILRAVKIGLYFGENSPVFSRWFACNSCILSTGMPCHAWLQYIRLPTLHVILYGQCQMIKKSVGIVKEPRRLSHRGGQKLPTGRVALPVADNIFKWMFFTLFGEGPTDSFFHQRIFHLADCPPRDDVPIREFIIFMYSLRVESIHWKRSIIWLWNFFRSLKFLLDVCIYKRTLDM